MKKTTSVLIAFLSFFIVTGNLKALEVSLDSKNAILYNLKEDTILFQKQKDEKISIASMTKLMTTIVALEKIKNLDATVTLTNEAFKGLVEANAAVVGFHVGQTVTYRDLLYGTLLVSGADATKGLAISLAGTEAKFVEWMNEKAKELKLKNTNFVNTTGLDVNNHYSTVEDVAAILKYCLKNEQFKTIFKDKQYTSSDRTITMKSTLQKSIDNYNLNVNYIVGAKTGYTDDAGLCLASFASQNGVDYLLVTARATYSKTTPYHMLDAKNVYDYYFKTYGYHNIIEKGDKIITLKTKNTQEAEINILSPTTISKFLENTFDKSKVTYEYEGVEQLTSKNKQGSKLGIVKIIVDNEQLGTIDIILDQTLHFSIWKYLINNIYIILGIIVIIVIIIIPKKKKRNS